jgi:hypothetical protein
MIKKLLTIIAFGLFTTGISYGQVVDLGVAGYIHQQCDTALKMHIPITVYNHGGVPIIGGAVCQCSYSVNGGATVTETLDIPNTLATGDSATMYFATPYDFSTCGIYDVFLSIDYLADDTTNNDSMHVVQIFHQPPSFGNHVTDTTICMGSPAVLWMEILGDGPWSLVFSMGPDTIPGLPVDTNYLATEMNPTETTVFGLISLTDVNGCTTMVNQSVTIGVADYPVVNIGHDTTLCSNQSITLDAGNPGCNYLWSNLETTPTAVYDSNTAGWTLGDETVTVTVDTVGCSASDTLIIHWINCGSNVEEHPEVSFQLFPNPTKGSFNIQFNGMTGTVQCEILDHLGRTVYNETFVDVQNNSLRSCFPGNLSRGMYNVVLHNSDFKIIEKVMVE